MELNLKETNDDKGYMFINGLKVIKKQVDELLSYLENPKTEEQLKNIVHNEEWVQSHLTSSEDDITEIYNYLSTNLGEIDEYVELNEEEEIDESKYCPTQPDKWSASKSLAKTKFDVYPSAYANAWAAKNYKEKGGKWKKCGKNNINEDIIRMKEMIGFK